MPETKTAKDWVTPTVIFLGGASVLTGLFLFLRKPPGLSPGEKINAAFSFNYFGEVAPYSLSVRFGYYHPFYLPFGFDEEETLGHHRLEIQLTSPNSYEFTIAVTIPDGAKAGSYDAEAAILTPDMKIGQEWLIRVYNKQVLTVRKV